MLIFFFVLLLIIPVVWWLIASWSVALFLNTKSLDQTSTSFEPLSLFKPLPPLKNIPDCQRYAQSLESFVKQLCQGDEVLILVHQDQETFWRDKVNFWEGSQPGISIKLFVNQLEHEAKHTNPKIDAMALLAPHASHNLWWWSDADITVPLGEVQIIRNEFEQSQVALQTQAYLIPTICRTEDWLDALFVHIELLPGLTLLSRKKEVNFACGGSLLFRKDVFEERVKWDELGAEIADDYFLGKKMQPVRLGRSLMCTQSGEEGLFFSWCHYFRWQKTVRWCQPAGFTALFFLQPLGLTLLAGLLGLGGWMLGGFLLLLLLLEACWVTHLFRKLNIYSGLSVFWISPLWSFVRFVTWLLCWFPLAVSWYDIKWWKSKASSVRLGEN
ncbi:MAG: glycosyltransferase [Blastochloris sp.]|nr:glycosyltransferase [Blastochloris sp.]